MNAMMSRLMEVTGSKSNAELVDLLALAAAEKAPYEVVLSIRCEMTIRGMLAELAAN